MNVIKEVKTMLWPNYTIEASKESKLIKIQKVPKKEEEKPVETT